MVSLAAFWSAAENVACNRTVADVNSVVVSADAIWPAAANYACYFNIAIDSYIAAAGIFIVIFVAITSAVNIDYFTAGNGETVSVAVNVRIIFADGFTISCYVLISVFFVSCRYICWRCPVSGV